MALSQSRDHNGLKNYSKASGPLGATHSRLSGKTGKLSLGGLGHFQKKQKDMLYNKLLEKVLILMVERLIKFFEAEKIVLGSLEKNVVHGDDKGILASTDLKKESETTNKELN